MNTINWDMFFLYGNNTIEDECLFDLYQLLMQPKRSLYYNRQESAGISEYENRPNGIDLQIFARFEIANAVAYRNMMVTDGSNNMKDRRIAISQNSIGFESKGSELNINVLYFLYENYESPKSNTFPLAR